jgi:hypothetical protein
MPLIPRINRIPGGCGWLTVVLPHLDLTKRQNPGIMLID